ncbi:GNAT family N-acetyltransferase [Kangiella shandongensis]|uniref:GNAT family N-acetyltransferase n=1 Tax=Kangiella shandongensis TaxID=2763258 RepID=UPI001CBE62AE|nr:GNAT family N-acetyltransferase [Kangiella shandongensis]
MATKISIHPVTTKESTALGQLMVEVYSSLEGFPSPQEQPDYYRMLERVGELATKPGTEVFVASKDGVLLGGVVYFSDMGQYGSGGSATQQKHASGFRLLAVSKSARGLGVGKALTEFCIKQAVAGGNQELIIHTTEAMKLAWSMYERLGFKRSEDLDFLQQGFPVFGFKLALSNRNNDQTSP